jgi:lactate dehydrogenase-like 2-hydroxyacid dehydrogenase
MPNWNVYVTRQIPQPGIDLLKQHCAVVDINPRDEVLPRAELLKQVRGRDGVLCLLTDTIDREVFDAAGKQCKGFANYAVGFNNVDIQEATRRGILVSNTPGVLTDATADMAWALLFCVARRLVEADAFMRSGQFKGWGPMMFLGGDITGRTLGVIGAGRIGSAMAAKSAGFGMRVLYYDLLENKDLETKLGARKVGLEELLRESDFISVHLDLNEKTRHFIGEPQLRLMKKTAYLINTSRGPVIDETALVRALKENWIAGAGLDVYEDEPAMKPGLKDCWNAVLCPHIASATFQTRAKMAIMAATNLIAMLKGERPPNLVNPEAIKQSAQTK